MSSNIIGKHSSFKFELEFTKSINMRITVANKFNILISKLTAIKIMAVKFVTFKIVLLRPSTVCVTEHECI